MANDSPKFAALAEKLEKQWEDNYKLLKEFIEENNRFPHHLETYKGVNLGSWFCSQKHKMKKPSYPAERFKKLDELGVFSKEFFLTYDDIWEKNYLLLKDYVKENSCFPKQKEIYKGVGIGSWCTIQRAKSKETDFPVERLAKLKEIGLLDGTRDEVWEQKFKLLNEFIAENGRLPVAKETYKDINLGQWCQTQKQAVKQSNYSEERINKLIAVGLLFKENIKASNNIPEAEHNLVNKKPTLFDQKSVVDIEKFLSAKSANTDRKPSLFEQITAAEKSKDNSFMHKDNISRDFGR